MPNDVLDDVLAAYHRTAAPPDHVALGNMRRKVLTGIAGRRPPTRRVGILAAAVAGVVAVAAVAVGIVVLPADRSPMPDRVQMTSAAALLDQIASRVSGARSVSLPAGQFLYTRRHAIVVSQVTLPDGTPAWYRSETVHQIWARTSGLGWERARITTGRNARPLRASDAAKLNRFAPGWNRVRVHDPLNTAKGKVPAETPGPGSFAQPTPEFLAALPADPDRLLAMLREAAVTTGNVKWSTDQIVFDLVFGLVSWSDALLRPDLRAALYRALGRLPGLERTTGQVDLAGRSGIGFGRAEGAQRQEIVIDPETSRVLGTRLVSVTAEPGLPAGTVLETSTSDQWVVPSVPAGA